MPETPKLEEVLIDVLRQNAEQLRSIEPGEVISWDKSEQTATIQPLVRDRSGEDKPQIYQVPVIQPVTYHDVQVGEVGLLLICDRNPMRWWRDNQQSDPEGNASHHSSNAIFLPGLRSKDDARTIPSNTAVLEKPVVGGDVHLGVQGAIKAVVHEDFLSDVTIFYGNGGSGLIQWVTAVSAATGVAGASVLAALSTLQSGMLANKYKSPSVKVEN